MTAAIATPPSSRPSAKNCTRVISVVADKRVGARAASGRGPHWAFRSAEGKTASANTVYYNWNRWYEPGGGRYWQPDPLGQFDDLTSFGYAGGDPLGRIDPWGLACKGLVSVVPCRTELVKLPPATVIITTLSPLEICPSGVAAVLGIQQQTIEIPWTSLRVTYVKVCPSDRCPANFEWPCLPDLLNKKIRSDIFRTLDIQYCLPLPGVGT